MTYPAGMSDTAEAVDERGGAADLGSRMQPPSEPAPQEHTAAILDEDDGKAIEQLTKLGTLLTVLMYVLGLLTVNAYLRYLGVSDFSLIKPRYVYVGFWLGFGVALATAVWVRPAGRVLSYLRLQSGEADGKPSRSWMALVTIALWAIAFAALWRLGAFSLRVRALDAVALTAVCLLLNCLLRQIWLLLNGKRRMRDARRVELVAVLALFPLVLGLYIWGFGVVVYPIIPAQFGGAKGEEIQVLMGDTQAAGQFAALSLPFVAGQPVSLPVQVLFENDDSYVLGVPDRVVGSAESPTHDDFIGQFSYDQITSGFRVVQIQKKDVKGLIVPGEPQPAKADLELQPDALTIGVDPAPALHLIASTADSCTTIYYDSGLKAGNDTASDPLSKQVSVRIFGRRPAHASCPSNGSRYPVDVLLSDLLAQNPRVSDFSLRLFTAKPDQARHCLVGTIHVDSTSGALTSLVGGAATKIAQSATITSAFTQCAKNQLPK